MDKHGQHKDYAFKFVPGTMNGRECMMVQIWLKDAAFSTVEQGFWDSYAFKFKFPHWKEIPADLRNACDYAYKAQFNPKKKHIG